MRTLIQLEPEARAFAEAAAKQPFLSNLGPEKGRAALEELQSRPVALSPVKSPDTAMGWTSERQTIGEQY